MHAYRDYIAARSLSCEGVLLAVTVLCLCARPCRLRITPHQRTFTYLQLCVYGAHDRERERESDCGSGGAL
jgi:hypothetical protein